MNRKSRLAIKLGILAVIAALTVYYFAGIKGLKEDPYELLTILGDVSMQPHPLVGRWRPVRDGGKAASLTLEEREKLSELMALPYASGSTKAPGVENVTVFDPDGAFDGVNLYTSGHGPEAILMDMRGKVLHKWRYPIEKIWPEVPETEHGTFWRKVFCFKNGDLLALFEGIGILKLDKDSNLLWAFREGCHHQAFVTEEGNIYVLTRRGQMNPEINPAEPVLPDAITVLSPEGERIREVDLLESFEGSPFKSLIKGMIKKGDLFHTNSIHVFDGSQVDHSPLYRKGNVLLSILKLSVIAIVDMEKEEVVWAHKGPEQRPWVRQHDPNLLENGNILLFDNLGRRGMSRVVEFDPRSERIAWQFPGRSGEELFSKTCGTCERLGNGNTLITESDNGRAIEVTPDKKIVWEFINPHRSGENGEMIATLFELIRLGKDYVQWLELDP